MVAGARRIMAKTTVATLDDGLLILDINTTGSRLDSVTVTNNDTRDATFRAFDTNGGVLWTYTQAAGTTATVVPPALGWTIGQVTVKGTTFTTLISPAWSLTFV